MSTGLDNDIGNDLLARCAQPQAGLDKHASKWTEDTLLTCCLCCAGNFQQLSLAHQNWLRPTPLHTLVESAAYCHAMRPMCGCAEHGVMESVSVSVSSDLWDDNKEKWTVFRQITLFNLVPPSGATDMAAHHDDKVTQNGPASITSPTHAGSPRSR